MFCTKCGNAYQIIMTQELTNKHHVVDPTENITYSAWHMGDNLIYSVKRSDKT